MGGRDSSSKRKSSKRKRDKISSKKKSRRKEPKKLRRNYDSDSSNSERSLPSTSKSDYRRRINKNKKRRRDSSVSSYSDDWSVSSDSDSLSTNDNGYKSRKARQSRVGLKDTKKSARKRFSSPSGDVDGHSVRKRKRSDKVVKPKKKSSKKKSRKYLSSSSSSDSESFSTYQSRSSSRTADGKRQGSKVIHNKEIKRQKDRELHRGKKRRKVSTPSCSSCGRDSDPSISVGNSDGAQFPMNNSRRLKSVIAVVNQPRDEGENRWEMDQHKEEIVYDQNDFPSPKSVDSNEGGSKMESGNHSHGDRTCVENVTGEETESTKSRIDEVDRNRTGDLQAEGAHMNDSEEKKKIDVPVPDAASGGDALESILRQKALENLKKFKGRLQTGPRSTTVKMTTESDVDRSSDGTVDIVQNKSIKQGSSNAQEMNQSSGHSLKRDFSLVMEVKKLPDSENNEKVPGMAKQSVVRPPNVTAPLECPKEDKYGSSDAVVAEPISRSDTGPGTGGANACSSSNVEPSSSVGPISAEHSQERGNEAKDGSQYEQKTMSVMRGGELVQVSYKVYIPKKVPALARRQLRR